jgi:hypothetical protein
MMLHEPSGHSQREVNAAHSLLFQATLLLDESRALSYAVVMALAHTPREELSREEIDGLCQLAYTDSSKQGGFPRNAAKAAVKRSVGCIRG